MSEGLDQVSKLHIFSMGRAVENKAELDPMLRVNPYELTLMADGEMTTAGTQEVASGYDSKGQAYHEKVTSSNTIEAVWLGAGSSNRISPPDVRIGMEVIIWQFGNSNHYYWELRDEKSGLANTETVQYAWSANSDDNAPRTPDNSYYLEVDTRRKLVTFSTSQKMGEKTSYGIQFDPGNGRLIIQDSQGQQIAVNSVESSITLTTEQEAVLQLLQQHLNITLPGNWVVAADGSVSIKAQGPILWESGASIAMKAPAISIDGALSMTGTSAFKGNIALTGSLAATGNVTAPNID